MQISVTLSSIKYLLFLFTTVRMFMMISTKKKILFQRLFGNILLGPSFLDKWIKIEIYRLFCFQNWAILNTLLYHSYPFVSILWTFLDSITYFPLSLFFIPSHYSIAWIYHHLFNPLWTFRWFSLFQLYFIASCWLLFRINSLLLFPFDFPFTRLIVLVIIYVIHW